MEGRDRPNFGTGRTHRELRVGFQSPVRRMFERLGRAVVLVDEAAQDRMADDLRWHLVARRWADG